MKKEDLIKAMANEPDNISVEVALKGGNEDNTLYREVIGVEHRHDTKTGKAFVSLICLKSLKEQKANTRSVLEEAKRIKDEKRQAALKQALQEHKAPELKEASEVKPPQDVKPMQLNPIQDVKPIELKPMPGVKPMQLKRKATHTMADLPNIVSESLQQTETGQQAQADPNF